MGEEGGVYTIRGIRVRLLPEQVQVMSLMARGWSYREIGASLGFSRRSVRRRVLSACEAIGAENRMEALSLLLQEGVVKLDT